VLQPSALPVADDSRFLIHAAKERNQHSVQRVLDVLRRFDRDGVPITFVGVATAASVSRSWLYREPILRPEILRYRGTAPAQQQTPIVPAAQRSSAQSQRQRNDTLNEEIRWVRQDNARLRSQLERSLGEQRLTSATKGPAATISSVRDMSPTQTT
jgi:hypothetical protein